MNPPLVFISMFALTSRTLSPCPFSVHAQSKVVFHRHWSSVLASSVVSKELEDGLKGASLTTSTNCTAAEGHSCCSINCTYVCTLYTMSRTWSVVFLAIQTS